MRRSKYVIHSDSRSQNDVPVELVGFDGTNGDTFIVSMAAHERRRRRASSARRSACSNSVDRMAARATTSDTRNRTRPIVRQSDSSPGEPGCWAMLVNATPQEISANSASVAARIKRLRPIRLKRKPNLSLLVALEHVFQ